MSVSDSPDHGCGIKVEGLFYHVVLPRETWYQACIHTPRIISEAHSSAKDLHRHILCLAAFTKELQLSK